MHKYYKLISQGICGNPWPMLNTAVQSLGYYKDTTEKCAFEYYLFGVDPEDCSRFYSCIKGIYNNVFYNYSKSLKSIYFTLCHTRNNQETYT